MTMKKKLDRRQAACLLQQLLLSLCMSVVVGGSQSTPGSSNFYASLGGLMLQEMKEKYRGSRFLQTLPIGTAGKISAVFGSLFRSWHSLEGTDHNLKKYLKINKNMPTFRQHLAPITEKSTINPGAYQPESRPLFGCLVQLEKRSINQPTNQPYRRTDFSMTLP